MTPIELEAFIRAQAKMSTRIARKAARVREIAMIIAQGTGGGPGLGMKVLRALTRPGVCPTQRPKSAAGAQSFHFALTTVNRTSDFVAKFTGSKTGQSAAHESYIERDGAAERLGAQFAKTNSEMREEVWEALGGQSYIERPDAAEVVDGLRIASFGNIAQTIDDRLAYWRAMEEAAAKPKTNGIATQRGNDAAFWAKVDTDPTAPEILKNAPAFVPLPANENDPTTTHDLNLPKVVPTPRYSDKLASEVLDYVRKNRSKTKAAKEAPAVTIDPGRGGRIQSRIIVELPHELTPGERLKLAQDYCHKKFVEGREIALPHWCVIHAPDHHNDPRNAHMHIVFAERPAKRMLHPETEKECWDFEIIETTKDKHRNTRARRPFEKNADRSINSSRWVGQARKEYADMANAALKAAGKKKIYDARTYKAMGIDEKPRERVNAKDYRKEKQGETTAGAESAINAQWEREEQRLSARFNRFGAPKRNLDAFDVELARWRHAPNAVWGHLAIHRHEYAVSTAYLQVMKAEKAANSFVLSKIQSKIMPPLQARDEDALLAQDFIRMFRRDIVNTYDEGMKVQKRNAERSLKALAAAQAANPRTTMSADFLTGRNMETFRSAPFRPEDFDRGTSPIEMLKMWRDAMIVELQDAREMRAVMTEQMAARRGYVLKQPTQQPANAQAGGPAKQEGTSGLAQPTTQSPAGQGTAAGKSDAGMKTAGAALTGSPAPGVAKQPDAARAASPRPLPPQNPMNPQYGFIPKGFSKAPEEMIPGKIEECVIPPDGVMTGAGWVPTTQAQKDAYARALKIFAPGGIPTNHIDRLKPAPESQKVYGDEVVVPFFSESGEPIQHRVFSKAGVRTADEQAAAVEAAIKKRRAERQAKLEAEVAAMRERSDAEKRADAAAKAKAQAATTPASMPTRGTTPTTVTAGRSQAQTTSDRETPSTASSTAVAPTIKKEATMPTTIAAKAAKHEKTSAPKTAETTATQTPATGDSAAVSKPNSETANPSTQSNHNSTTPRPSGPASNPTTTNPPSGNTEPGPKKKRVLTSEERRKRALLAAKSRGRSR